MLLWSIEKARQDFPEVVPLTELYWARFAKELGLEDLFCVPIDKDPTEAILR